MRSVILKQFGVYIFVIVNLLSYEQHLHEEFGNYIALLSFLILFFTIVFIKLLLYYRGNFYIKMNLGNSLFFFLILFLLISLSYKYIVMPFPYLSIQYYLKGLISILWLTWAIIFLNKEDILIILDTFYKVGIVLSILNITIWFNDGFFIWNKTMVVRASSIFSDPNFWGGFNLFLILYSLFFKHYTNLFWALFVNTILLISLILSFSKASLLVLTFVFISYLLLFSKRIIRLLSLIVIPLVVYSLYYLLQIIPFFRLGMGLNKRDDMWLYFFQKIWEIPFLGYGEEGIEYFLINEGGFSNTSFHNFLFDKTFAFGLLYGFLVIIMFSYILYKLFKFNRAIFLIFLGLTLNSFFIDYSLGGLKPNSIIFSLLVILSLRIKKYGVLINENNSRN